ncbi:MAG TPA: Eco57I restriction-modification methylase domain-containing protein [Lacunisphaera sp.]|jgi:adenine-specific DNA-methyltransferase
MANVRARLEKNPPVLLAPAKLETEKRELGQFFTPPQLAAFVASFFTCPLSDWRIIDAGAGSGALTVALLQKVLAEKKPPVSFHVTAYEIDPAAIEQLRDTLERCAVMCAEHYVRFTSELRTEDFIEQTTASLEQGFFAPALKTFNAAIVNPPYRKLAVGSRAHHQLREIGIDVSNLYSGFLALLSRVLEADAELVAIVPRSFCNGPYFRAFRRDFMQRMALRRLHVFESRTAAFSNEAVLQENIILRAERSSTPPSTVEISSSHGDFTDSVRSQLLPWPEIVSPQDEEAFVRLPANEREHSARVQLAGLNGRLSDLNLTVSTGKVVDFRARDHLRPEGGNGSYPLLYPSHFEAGLLRWPKIGGKKPNAIHVPATRTDLLIPAGVYVVVRRFSSKEEKKRIVASLLDPTRLPPGVEWIGIENHLNYFHEAGHGLPLTMAKGLVAYLNWSVVDAYFRHFNGHTQVNATDLRSLPFPSTETLVAVGNALGGEFPTQLQLDALVESHCV